MFRITILLSGKHGQGSNMAALYAACESGQIPNCAVTNVIGTHPDSPAINRARNFGIETETIQGRGDDFNTALAESINTIKPDLICLAGYMRKIPDSVITRYPNKIVNIHPALLPSFGGKGMYGINIHQAVIAYGCKISGCTVHFVDNDFDTGPIILQECVKVLDDDTPESLAKRILVAEHATYAHAVKLIAEGRVQVNGRHVIIT